MRTNLSRQLTIPVKGLILDIEKGATGKTVSPQGLIQKEVTAWIRALAVTSFYKPERTGYKYQ